MGVYEFSSSVLRQSLTSSCWPPTCYVTEVGLELLSLMPGYGPIAIEGSSCEKRMSRVWQGCLAVSTSGINKYFCPMLAAVWPSQELLISLDMGLHILHSCKGSSRMERLLVKSSGGMLATEEQMPFLRNGNAGEGPLAMPGWSPRCLRRCQWEQMGTVSLQTGGPAKDTTSFM